LSGTVFRDRRFWSIYAVQTPGAPPLLSVIPGTFALRFTGRRVPAGTCSRMRAWPFPPLVLQRRVTNASGTNYLTLTNPPGNLFSACGTREQTASECEPISRGEKQRRVELQTEFRNRKERARHGRSFPRPRGKHGRTGTIQHPCQLRARFAGREARRQHPRRRAPNFGSRLQATAFIFGSRPIQNAGGGRLRIRAGQGGLRAAVNHQPVGAFILSTHDS